MRYQCFGPKMRPIPAGAGAKAPWPPPLDPPLSVMHASEWHTSNGKVYIKIFRLVSTQRVYRSYSSILTIHGLIG